MILTVTCSMALTLMVMATFQWRSSKFTWRWWPRTWQDQAKHAFDFIDTDKNGEISREEFLAAAIDFYFGVEETELAAAFMGKLVD